MPEVKPSTAMLSQVRRGSSESVIANDRYVSSLPMLGTGAVMVHVTVFPRTGVAGAATSFVGVVWLVLFFG